MKNRKKLLVLVDGSDRSIRTIDYVKAFMPLDETMWIVLFHVFRGLPDQYREIEADPALADNIQQLKDWETGQEKLMRTYLEKMKAGLVAGGFPENQIEIKFQHLNQGVARDIIAEAKQGYSAVVMSRRGMATALQNIILGSVAVKLLQCISFIPTIFVGPALPVRKILLAVDASASSVEAADFLGTLLGGGGSYEICIFHAIMGLGKVDFEMPDPSGTNRKEVQLPDIAIETFKLKVANMIQEIKDRLLAAGFESGKISEKIVSGVHSRSEAIVSEAEAGGYGTIVVGRRGLSRLEAFFMGRVGHKVVYGGKHFTVCVV